MSVCCHIIWIKGVIKEFPRKKGINIGGALDTLQANMLSPKPYYHQINFLDTFYRKFSCPLISFSSKRHLLIHRGFFILESDVSFHSTPPFFFHPVDKFCGKMVVTHKVWITSFMRWIIFWMAYGERKQRIVHI